MVAQFSAPASCPAKSAFFRSTQWAQWFARQNCCRSRRDRQSGRRRAHPSIWRYRRVLRRAATCQRREHDDAPATSAYRRLTALTVPASQRGGHRRRDRAAVPRFDRVRRSASRLPRQSVLCRYGDLDQLTPGMRPTLGQPDVGTGTIRGDQAVISSVTVHLKDACEPNIRSAWCPLRPGA